MCAVAIPHGFEIQVRPRSGLALKHGISVPNSPGTIDSDYRGEVKVIVINHGAQEFAIRRGDRIAQLVLAPVTRASWLPVDELDETARGEGGFGYDSLFIPEGYCETFGQLSAEIKNELSHRGRALALFAEWMETEK